MKLSTEAARSALSGLAKKLGMSVEETAWGVFEIVTEQMASAARVHIAEKGADPRQYVFIATGGAGPAHAFHIARKLYIGRIVCPPAVGVASTVGLLMARPRSDAVRAYVADVSEVDWERVNSIFGEMKNQVLEGLGAAGVEEREGGWTFRIAADMRYRGQVDGVTVQVPGGKEGIPVPDGEALKRLFEEAYIARYCRKIEGVPVEFASWRLTLLGPQPEEIDMRPPPEAEKAPFLKGKRPIYLGPEGGYAEAGVYDRYALPGGERFAGPAVIEERESTTIVPPGASFERDDSGNLLLTLGEG